MRTIRKISEMVEILFFLLGFYLFWNTWNFKKTAIATTGYIMNLPSDRLDTGQQVAYSYPKVFRVKYVDSNAHEQEVELYALGTYLKDQVVPILYNDANPREVRIDEFLDLWALPIVCTVISILILIPWVLISIGNSRASDNKHD